MAPSLWGKTADGQPVYRFVLQKHSIRAEFTNFGATVLSLQVPDGHGIVRDVVLGYDDLASYEKSENLFGATVGRVVNRIAGAEFTLNGRTYHLDRNEGENCNHGGFKGYHKRVWQIGESGEDYQGFFLDSPSGDQGFPGNLRLHVRFELKDYALAIHYDAVCDEDTLCNITNHCYFNLNGQGNGSIEDHYLQIFAGDYMPLRGKDSIPDGVIRPVRGTPFDFMQLKRIGSDIDADDPQIAYGHGYNHNYLLNLRQGMVKTAARLESKSSGLGLEVRTDMPGLEYYSGNELPKETGKQGVSYGFRSGVALETQFAPDSIHHPSFPSCILPAGKVWHSLTEYRFFWS